MEICICTHSYVLWKGGCKRERAKFGGNRGSWNNALKSHGWQENADIHMKIRPKTLSFFNFLNGKGLQFSSFIIFSVRFGVSKFDSKSSAICEVSSSSTIPAERVV